MPHIKIKSKKKYWVKNIKICIKTPVTKEKAFNFKDTNSSFTWDLEDVHI